MLIANDTARHAEASAIYARLMAEPRIIISHRQMNNLIDFCGDRPRMEDLASCRNRHQCGTLDEYVAWIGRENRPGDLEFRAGYAIGSK